MHQSLIFKDGLNCTSIIIAKPQLKTRLTRYKPSFIHAFCRELTHQLMALVLQIKSSSWLTKQEDQSTPEQNCTYHTIYVETVPAKPFTVIINYADFARSEHKICKKTIWIITTDRPSINKPAYPPRQELNLKTGICNLLSGIRTQ